MLVIIQFILEGSSGLIPLKNLHYLYHHYPPHNHHQYNHCHHHVCVQGGERIAWEFHHVTLQRVPGYGFGIAVSVLIM